MEKGKSCSYVAARRRGTLWGPLCLCALMIAILLIVGACKTDDSGTSGSSAYEPPSCVVASDCRTGIAPCASCVCFFEHCRLPIGRCSLADCVPGAVCAKNLSTVCDGCPNDGGCVNPGICELLPEGSCHSLDELEGVDARSTKPHDARSAKPDVNAPVDRQ